VTRYTEPFKLSAGRRHTVKAIAQPDSKRAAPSVIATKYFLISGSESKVVRSSRHNWKSTHVEHTPKQKSEVPKEPQEAAGHVRSSSPVDDMLISEETHDSDEYEIEEEKFLEERRWGQIRDAAECDLCRVPWQNKDSLYCHVCGYRRPESIGIIAEVKNVVRELEPASPARGAIELHSSPDNPQRTTGLLSVVDELKNDIKIHTQGGTSSPCRSHSALKEHERKVATSEKRLAKDIAASVADGSRLQCPGCSVSVCDSDRICMRCGTQLHSAIHDPPAVSVGGALLTAKTQSGDKATSELGIAGMIRCLKCNNYSPQTSSTCLTCDSSLSAPATAVPAVLPKAVLSATDMLGTEGVMVCKSCSKANPKGSRFCNWCGFKAPIPVQQVQLCPSCKTENLLSSAFCSDCGGQMPRPHDLDERNAIGGGDHSIMALFTRMEDNSVALHETQSTSAASAGPRRDAPSDITRQQAYAALTDTDRRILQEARERKTRMTSTGVQTALYFPSSQKIAAAKAKGKAKHDGFDRFAVTKIVGERPLDVPTSASAADLTGSTIAFGSGTTAKNKKPITTWRQQIDHTFVALKDFSRNKSHESAKFQAQMMEFSLGSVTAAEMRQDGDEVVLTVAMVDLSLTSRTQKAKRRKETSVQTEERAGTMATLAELGYGRGQRLKPSNRGRSGWSKLCEALMFELGSRGDGRTDTVLGLIDQGADVNSHHPKTKERLLNVAAEFGRTECLKFLLDNGAQIDSKSGSLGETALHSAVRGQSPSTRECIIVLLDAGADATKMDNALMTPMALADKLGLASLRTFFAARVGATSLAALSQS